MKNNARDWSIKDIELVSNQLGISYRAAGALIEFFPTLE